MKHEIRGHDETKVTIMRLFFLLSCLLLSTASGQADDPLCQRHRQALEQHADVVRYYTFDSISPDAPVVASRAGQQEAMRYASEKPIEVVEGFWPGTQAVRLDAGSLQTQPVAVGNDGFTVEIRFQKHGPGSLLGNGRTNGMLFAQGDGYWSGFRVWTGYPDKSLHFELGRPRPNHAFGLTGSGPVPDGVWHHLAATWDGLQMRLYLNGVLLGAAVYTGQFAATDAPLRLGYANAGVGSVKMDVDELAIFKRALTPVEILEHAFAGLSLPEEIRSLYQTGTAALAQAEWETAGQSFARILALPDAPPLCYDVARFALARTYSQRGQWRKATAQYATVFESKNAPESLREVALRMCVPRMQHIANPLATTAIYERLAQITELSETEKVAVRNCLAECYLNENQPIKARQQFESLLRLPNLTALEKWNLRLQSAHTYLADKDYLAARAAYAALTNEPDAPDYARGIAALAFAHTHVRQGQFATAESVFARIAQRTDLPACLRKEAEERAREMRRRTEGRDAEPRPKRRNPPSKSLRPRPAVVSFFVAPNGNDQNDGTLKRPFATLTRARDAIRRLKQTDGLPAGGVAVYVRGGTYRMNETFHMTEEDSGGPRSPVVYRALPNESPIFSGGVILEGFRPVTDPSVLDRLPEATRSNIVEVDLPALGITDFGRLGSRGYGRSGYPTHPWVDLYVSGKAQPLARWPNDGTLAVGKVHRGGYNTDQSREPGEFDYDEERPGRWSQTDDIWMFGAWGHLWEGTCVKVAGIDADQNRIATSQRATYGYREGMPYYFFNVLEELDQQGEWYLDRKTGVLYLYPPEDLATLTAQFPLLSTPFVTMTDVKHVTLQGLTFELGRAEGAVIKDGTDNLLVGCTFRQLGTNGLIVAGGRGHGVWGCDIHTLGAGGVRMSGGDRATLTAAHHVVENCHIYDFSRVDRVYAPAVHLDGVGNRIAHNLFHDSPHHAMRVEGYEHVIEFNEVHSVVYEFDDQAGIDMFGNPAYRGNVIRYNFWHHIGSGHDVAGQSGIRLDDFISGVHVYGNVFYRCAGGRFGGVQIHGGKDNIVDNNLFIDCRYAISFSPWGEKRYHERLDRERTQSAITRGGVDISQPPHSERYPDLARMRENVDRNFVWRNVTVDCGGFAARDRGVNEFLDNHAFVGDPGFADRAERDFSLREDSPIYYRFGFRPIPFGRIGLYEDEDRASWPVEHEVSSRYVVE
ncbi:MAG: LamG-like jellyroll fold domain-containing protein [Pirellulaceae bacterium]